MIDRTALLSALDAIAAARRYAMGAFDTARSAKLAANATGAVDESPLQTSASIVRCLENAARELTDAIQAIDQLDRLTK